MAPANRLRLEGRHAHGAVFTRRPGIAVRRGVAGRGCRRGSFARDLNLDQIVTARSAISPALFGEIHGVLRHPPVRLRRALPPASRRIPPLLLRAERQPDGRRDYKLAVKDPLPTSFGEDLNYRL